MPADYEFAVKQTNLDEGGIPYTPVAATDAGKLIIQGHLIGYTKRPLAAGEHGAIHWLDRVEAKKENTTDTFAVGDQIFWDSTNLYVTATPTPWFLGVCIKAAAATDNIVEMVFIPTPGGALIKSFSEVVERANYTDNGDATGYIDLTTQVPAGSLVLGHETKVATGYAGDTTAVEQLGTSGDLDRFSKVTTNSVLAAGTVGDGVASDASEYCAAATTLRHTVTGASDFGLITTGKAQITVFYIPFTSAPVSP